VLDVRTLRRLWSRIGTRRVNAAAKCAQVDGRLRSLMQALIGETDHARSRATRHIKRHRSTDPLPEPGHAPTRSLARCSATEAARAFAAWPGDWSFPQIARRRSWGSITLRSFAPPAGDRSSLIDRAHVLFAFASSARFIFVGLISPLAEK
jgi:hypothetical protein